MTNFEKWKDEISILLRRYEKVAVVNNEPCSCYKADCHSCDMNTPSISCQVSLLKWLYSEYKEPAPKLTKREYGFLLFVENGYIARDSDNDLFWYENKPSRHIDEWRIDGGSATSFNRKIYTLFPFIKWEDEEPWKVEDLLKLEVEE